MAGNFAKLSIKRPIFIGCIVVLIVVMGIIGFNRLGVDLVPPTDFPMVTVSTVYPGTTPEEIEKLITKPLEEQISTISGLSKVYSQSIEGMSFVFAEFTYETEGRYAAERVREKVTIARNKLPEDLTEEPLVMQYDMQAIPIITFALTADVSPTELYDLAKEKIKPLFEQVSGVGEVQLTGGTRREIQVELDRNKLNAYEISAMTVAGELGNAGANVPVGKFDQGSKSTIFRTIGEFNNVDQIKKAVVSFSGDVANAVTLQTLGTVRDGAEDLDTITNLYYPFNKENVKEGQAGKNTGANGIREMRSCIMLNVLKQSGANSVAVADEVKKRLDKVNSLIKASPGDPKLIFVYDTSKHIQSNIDDVQETMILAIILAVIVVYLFLGNIRSTIITCIAIPNSLLGAFMLMYFTGFTINIITLMALTITIGLLVDDAIVVRENIFRKLESGMHPLRAAEHGTTEVALAVIATTLTIIAVFLPIAFLQGLVGRFFKQFGLTVVYAMCISLFDAMAVAPLLSAYFAGSGHKAKNIVVRKFDQFQDYLDRVYTKVVTYSLNHPILIIMITTVVFLGSIGVFFVVKKTFMNEANQGEYMVSIEMPPGTSLNGTNDTLMKIADKLKSIPELDFMYIQAGTSQGENHVGRIGAFLVPSSERKASGDEIKEVIRNIMKEYKFAKPTVNDYSGMGGGEESFMLVIKGDDLDVLTEYSEKLYKKLQDIPDLVEIKTTSQSGSPEFQIRLDEQKMQMLGVNQKMAGMELRYQVEGNVVGKLRDKGLEYDIRMRLKPEQRDLKSAYLETRVPNMQFKMIPLSVIASGENKSGLSKISRQDRSRIVTITANTAPGGAIGTAMNRTKEIIEKELSLPKGVSYSFEGMSDIYTEMVKNLIFAMVLAIVFIYLVLASLYESFITPAIILIALPPALSGAIYALFITGILLDMMSMISIIMLLGLVTKNSILLVDFALEGVRSGLSRKEAIINAGRVRLRPILMTTSAMLMGMLPMALGIGAAASYRVGMGVSIIGGLIVSTLITLVLVPALFEYIDTFREFIESRFRPTGDKEVLAEYFETSEMSDDLKKLSEKKAEINYKATGNPDNKSKKKLSGKKIV